MVGLSGTAVAKTDPNNCLCLRVVSDKGEGGIVIGNHDSYLLVRTVHEKIIAIRYDEVIASKWVPCAD
jgi:hypothetical protein